MSAGYAHYVPPAEKIDCNNKRYVELRIIDLTLPAPPKSLASCEPLFQISAGITIKRNEMVRKRVKSDRQTPNIAVG